MYFFTEKRILLRDLKFCWIQISLLDYQNNFVKILKIMNAKNFNILTTKLSVLSVLVKIF